MNVEDSRNFKAYLLYLFEKYKESSTNIIVEVHIRDKIVIVGKEKDKLEKFKSANTVSLLE